MLRNVFPVIKQLLEDSNDDSSSNSSDENLSELSDSSTEVVFIARRVLHRTKNFVENTVREYDEQEFIEDFRLNKETCYWIIERVRHANVLPTHTFGRHKITAEKAVLMTVWYVSNTVTFRQLSKLFDVSKSSAHRIVKKIIHYLVVNSKKFIKWPNHHRIEEIRNRFKKIKSMNGMIGAVDGCHINIQRPVEDSHVYCNRKSEYSILLQGVCDHEKRFIDVFCGEAGSIHDAKLLKRSSLYERAINGLLGNDYILGDSTYPCLEWLISPFRDNGNLTRNQKLFNYRHSSGRIVIENAFGLLKGRFRRLKSFENEDIKFIVQCVVAATALHNICVDFDDEVPYDLNDEDEDYNDEENIRLISGITSTDARRRQIFQEMFNEE